jgi:transposase
VLEAQAPERLQDALGRIAQLETTLAKVTGERDKLRRAYEQLKEHLELLRRRIFFAKAERIDIAQLELEFAETHAKLDALVQKLAEQATPQPGSSSEGDPPPPAKTRPKPTGRRNLADEDLPEERVEILNPVLEGEVPRIGFEESYKLRYRRGGAVRLVLARATYKTQPTAMPDSPPEKPTYTLVTVPMPKELFPRGLLAPSMIAHVLVQKYRWGMPFHRQARMYSSEGFKLDDAMMCRYAEDAGATLGCIVDAMAKEAKEQAFCLSTDATGVSIQPMPVVGRKRQACRKGHFFVVLADQDHVFFEFQAEHTSATVCDMFRGFSGYIQADAHAVYDAIFRGEARASPHDEPPKEVRSGAGP